MVRASKYFAERMGRLPKKGGLEETHYISCWLRFGKRETGYGVACLRTGRAGYRSVHVYRKVSAVRPQSCTYNLRRKMQTENPWTTDVTIHGRTRTLASGTPEKTCSLSSSSQSSLN